MILDYAPYSCHHRYQLLCLGVTVTFLHLMLISKYCKQVHDHANVQHHIMASPKRKVIFFLFMFALFCFDLYLFVFLLQHCLPIQGLFPLCGKKTLDTPIRLVPKQLHQSDFSYIQKQVQLNHKYGRYQNSRCTEKDCADQPFSMQLLLLKAANYMTKLIIKLHYFADNNYGALRYFDFRADEKCRGQFLIP